MDGLWNQKLLISDIYINKIGYMGKIKAIPIPMIYGLISNVIPQTQKSDTRLMLHFSISGYLEPWCVYYNDGDLIRVFE